MNIDQVPNIKNISSDNFFLIAGPCAIESEEMALEIASQIIGITDRLEIPFIFKGSFKKANRSRLDSFSGIGDEKALEILKKIGANLNKIRLQESPNNAAEIYLERNIIDSKKINFENSLVSKVWLNQDWLQFSQAA